MTHRYSQGRSSSRRHPGGISRVLTEKIDKLADDQKVTRAMLNALIENIDRLVRGPGGNGRGGQAGRRKG